PNVLPDLAAAMKHNPDLKVLVNGGYFDISTPYYEGWFEMHHLPIPAALQGNIEYRYYQSGHMVYVHLPALRQLHDNVAAFIRSTELSVENPGDKAVRIASAGHAVFAATVIALGILGLVQGNFAPIWEGVPKDFPTREGLVYLCAAVSLICGAGLFWQRSAGTAARVLFAYLLLWMVLFKVPSIARSPALEASYQSCGETAVLVAGAWVLYAWFAGGWDKRQLGFAVGERGVRLARVLYALALIAFGLSHFAYLNMTAPLI